MSYDVTSNGSQTVTDLSTKAGSAAIRPYEAPSTGAIARGLGWFSIGLGLSELLVPRALSRAIGVRKEHPLLLSLLGLREIVSGVGILAQPGRSSTWLKSRVVGDIIDLGLLGAAFNSPRRNPVKLAVATAAVAGVTAVDIWCAAKSTNAASGDRAATDRSLVAQRSAAVI
jgi:hypothetical protein